MKLAILGATGAVGRTVLRVLAERGLPVEHLTLLASERSAGTVIEWMGREYVVEAPREGCFRGLDFVIFSAGGARSREWAPRAAAEGAVVVDNSSAWRADPAVPLIVPEVNPGALRNATKGIIANPNCSTIQMVVALEAIRRAAGLTRVVATTFQSVSGAGETGRSALQAEIDGSEGPAPGSPFSRRIAGNVIPQIGPLDAAGWTEEERKMITETRKILSSPDLDIAATCVRVPVDVGHAVQVMVETEREMTADDARQALASFPGVTLPERAEDFPTPLQVAGSDGVVVGRVRTDLVRRRTLHLWTVADNLRKGAATNAVQIVELLARG